MTNPLTRGITALRQMFTGGHRNAQEELWAGPFGDAYTERNKPLMSANMALFGRILACTDRVWSVLELGAGTGANLQAIHALDPEIETTGIEVNDTAYAELEKHCDIALHGTIDAVLGPPSSIPQPGPPPLIPLVETRIGWRQWDMVFTKGLLIHVAPEKLGGIYRQIYSRARRYILLCEYYNPTPLNVTYRGLPAALWKRDFAGDMLFRFPDLRLAGYGFVYHRDRHPQDDITWFLLDKEPLS